MRNRSQNLATFSVLMITMTIITTAAASTKKANPVNGVRKRVRLSGACLVWINDGIIA